MDQETYFKHWEAVCKGLITEERWQEFCQQVLEELLETHKDVMVRLKNR